MLNAGIHGPNGVILDLEDSVAPDKKHEARFVVRNALRSVDFMGAERMVRINQGQRGLEDLEYILKNGIYPGIATHDVPLIEGAYKLLKKYKVPKDRYEFQMLYGVTPALRKSIIEKGHRLRVYVPFGEDWFPYSTRRLKENPKIASDIMKALFVRG